MIASVVVVVLLVVSVVVVVVVVVVAVEVVVIVVLSVIVVVVLVVVVAVIMLVTAHYYQKLKLLAYNSADLERFFHVPTTRLTSSASLKPTVSHLLYPSPPFCASRPRKSLRLFYLLCHTPFRSAWPPPWRRPRDVDLVWFWFGSCIPTPRRSPHRHACGGLPGG